MSTLLADLSHWCGRDLSADNNGDIATITGTTRGEQRVLRRLLTNPGDYIFEPTYGAGLPSYIGQPFDKAKVQALCVAQMLLEDVVAKSPTPTVELSQSPNDPTSIQMTITYTDQPTQEPVVLSYTLSS